jgi:hypothetical protein
MARCKVLALLLCEKATRDDDGTVALHSLFDRIITPPNPRFPKLFFVYYKVDVAEPCTITLRVTDPVGEDIPGHWSDSLSERGPVQSIWALGTSLFKQPGNYVLELRDETEISQPIPLVTTLWVGNKMGE